MVARRQKTILPHQHHAFLELFLFCTTAPAIWRLMQTPEATGGIYFGRMHEFVHNAIELPRIPW
jgi:hypothetical protein